MDIPISLIISSNTTLWITTTSSHLHQNKRSIKPDLQLSAFGVPGVYMYLHCPARFGGIYPSFLVNLFIIGLALGTCPLWAHAPAKLRFLIRHIKHKQRDLTRWRHGQNKIENITSIDLFLSMLLVASESSLCWSLSRPVAMSGTFSY